MNNGVSLTDWHQFKRDECYDSYNRIAYRKLQVPENTTRVLYDTIISEFCSEHLGKDYELSFRKLFGNKRSILGNEPSLLTERSQLNTERGEVTICNTLPNVTYTEPSTIETAVKATSKKKGFFCSELVALAYKLCGFLDPVKSSA
mmetsp:Transcript_2856/g.2469  ORF Transcript_2856/g.2469 Transcript_2856/m.2469 type:complete len:146 (-) Transcript_2856:475-912(-)